MSLTAGEKLAHYEILEPIGTGGMGEVYRARDTKLGRDVAIKVLPNESGRLEVYVRPFPNVEDGKWRVSRDGGGGPVWRADGREIFYRNGDAMMAVTVETGAGFEASHPELLFEGRYFSVIFRGYDVAPDGQKFLMIKPVEAVEEGLTSRQQIVVVLDWFEELERLVPVEK